MNRDPNRHDSQDGHRN
jgi:hypothetical protein